MANEGEGRSWGRVVHIVGVGLLGASACGAGYLLLDRFGGVNDPEITVQDGESADLAAATVTWVSGTRVGESSALITATQVPPREYCASIRGGINNPYRAVKAIKTDPRYSGVTFSEDPEVYVKDRSTDDGDPADGSIKHERKALSAFLPANLVHVGDEVCIIPGAQGGVTEATPAPLTISVTPTNEPTSTHTSLDSNNPVNCTNLGLPLDNAITDVCGVGQGGAKQTSLTCDGTNGQNGFLTVTGYDYDLNSSGNAPAVSVHAQVGPANQALPRDDFSSSCIDWRSNFPGFMHNNPDLFYPPITTPTPTETPGTPTSNIERGNWSVVRSERTNSEDAASLHAASVQSKGTFYADVFDRAKRNEAAARNISGRQSYRGRI